MGFFQIPDPSEDDDVVGEEDEDEYEVPIAHWVGGVVPVELVVARSEQAAVVVRGIVAYRDGFNFTLEAFLHRSVKRGRRRPFHAFGRWEHEGEAITDEVLRFGISWPDGGRATNLDYWGRGWADATEPAHGMEEGSGGGSDRHYSWEFWAWPLPAEGPLKFVCEWPAYQIPETFAAVDSEVLDEAANRAFPIWPDDAGRASHLTRGTFFRAARAHELEG